MNLLKETIEAITESGHTPDDIVFIGSEQSGHECTWEQFQRLADVEYNAGYGAQKVASDLIIVFRDGQRMDRHEYDGSECWSVMAPFKRPAQSLPITRLLVTEDQVGWKTVAECCAPTTAKEQHG